MLSFELSITEQIFDFSMIILLLLSVALALKIGGVDRIIEATKSDGVIKGLLPELFTLLVIVFVLMMPLSALLVTILRAVEGDPLAIIICIGAVLSPTIARHLKRLQLNPSSEFYYLLNSGLTIFCVWFVIIIVLWSIYRFYSGSDTFFQTCLWRS
jgi:hypothetical protein